MYNHANPVETGAAFPILPGSPAANATLWNCVGTGKPCSRRLEGSFDLRRFNVSFWQQYERLLHSLDDMGIIADIIVFHPYDNGHWGFDCLGGRNASTYDTTNDHFYLRYLAARFAAFKNVWCKMLIVSRFAIRVSVSLTRKASLFAGAMANEWSFCQCKSRGINGTFLQSPAPVWDDLFQALSAADPYKRQMSIHNGNLLYNHSRPWITHVSLQGLEDRTAEIRTKYAKPVIWDEVQYEGDIPPGWGRLTGQQEADRFWWGLSMGVFVGHSETILRPSVIDDDQPLWWAKGGTLIGSSPARIAWLRSLQGRLFPPNIGALTPSKEHFGGNASALCVATMLSDAAGEHDRLQTIPAGLRFHTDGVMLRRRLIPLHPLLHERELCCAPARDGRRWRGLDHAQAGLLCDDGKRQHRLRQQREDPRNHGSAGLPRPTDRRQHCPQEVHAREVRRRRPDSAG